MCNDRIIFQQNKMHKVNNKLIDGKLKNSQTKIGIGRYRTCRNEMCEKLEGR